MRCMLNISTSGKYYKQVHAQKRINYCKFQINPLPKFPAIIPISPIYIKLLSYNEGVPTFCKSIV